jgi:hypothetical protein
MSPCPVASSAYAARLGRDISSLPYNKIQAFSIETAGTFDRDSELEMYFSGLGKVRLEFSKNFNLTYVAQLIGWATM